MRHRLSKAKRQEAEELIVASVRLATRTLEEYQLNPNSTSPKEVLLAGILLFLVARDAI